MFKVMSLRILRDIASKIKKTFTIMVDETTDAGTEEQCVVVICWVVHEFEFSSMPWPVFICCCLPFWITG